MTQHQGTLRKMHTAADEDNLVHYTLPVGDELVAMNPLIGQKIVLSFEGQIACVHCGSKTKKSFNQGYCYRCLISLAQCDTCIIKPELCHYHQGTCREPQWGEAHCLTDHFVYLANTGTLKVGITRHVTDGISSRWMDQGATQALVMLRVKDRLTSGLVETAFKQHIADKTNWRTMLKGAPAEQDLHASMQALLKEIAPQLEQLSAQQGLQAIQPVEHSGHAIHYPVQHYPDKIKSINLDKTPAFEGELVGIKGQYWLLDGDRVINIRKYAGYKVTLSV
ncbi:DUF2797 domain-containing protein [Alteromonas aestuariivivens]|uniref:DUF2797 domain-containing protein n=1 Tax=Alteromonas aestuariivivens TaxID=1938339 RepID=A0A3D8M8H4_9ALTE|nr:DUF2797 domain-containing protein [Alteromonas aestuariivivens]RDV26137.1 DUF2797 domain-containing protein [Alteromonas aestuariivivens]